MSLFIVFQCIVLWVNPGEGDANKILTFVDVLSFETYIIFFVLVPFLGFFAYHMYSETNNNIILIMYIVAVFTRIRFAFSDVSEEMKDDVKGKSFLIIIGVFILIPIFYVFTSFFSLLKLGLTQEFFATSGYSKQLQNPFSWETNDYGPQYILLSGALYYILLALIEYL